MKTNKPGKQNVLFLHVEKIIFLVLILATVYYCYSAVALPLISWTPEQLNSDSSAAQQTIDASQYREDLKVVNYDERASDIRTGFPHDYYRTPKEWEQAVFSKKHERDKPRLFPLIKLRALSGVGPLMTKERESVFDSSTSTTGMGDMGAFGGGSMLSGNTMMGGMGTNASKLETAHWVLLTGLIPYEEQLKEYTKQYANALHSSADDYPVYLYVQIERNEIGDDNADGTPRWVNINAYDQYVENNKKWAGVGLDPVDIQYTLPPPSMFFQPMAGQLPPLANRQFGPEAAYPPYIPLMSDSLREQMKAQQDLQWRLLENQRNLTPEDIRKNQAGELDIFRGGTSGLGGGFGMSDGGMGMSGASGGLSGGMGGGNISAMYQGASTTNAMGMGGMSSTSGMGGMSGVSGMGGMMGDSMMGMGSGFGTAGLGNSWSVYTKVPPSVMVSMKYRLFRYFDFTVEPGKSYQYRVSLGLKNPNYLLADRFLTKEEATTKRQLDIYTEFSAPSGKVAVNSNARILAQGVGNMPTANRAWQPQNATISSIVFDSSDNEDYIAKGRNVSPGTVMNFRVTSEKVSSLTGSDSGMGGSGMSPDSMMSPGLGGRTTTSSSKTSTKTLEHVSGECLVDVVGKKKLIGSNADHTPAGQIMVMAFDGTLTIRSVKEDKLELDRYEKKVTNTDSMMGGLTP